MALTHAQVRTTYLFDFSSPPSLRMTTPLWKIESCIDPVFMYWNIGTPSLTFELIHGLKVEAQLVQDPYIWRSSQYKLLTWFLSCCCHNHCVWWMYRIHLWSRIPTIINGTWQNGLNIHPLSNRWISTWIIDSLLCIPAATSLKSELDERAPPFLLVFNNLVAGVWLLHIHGALICYFRLKNLSSAMAVGTLAELFGFLVPAISTLDRTLSVFYIFDGNFSLHFTLP